MWAESQEAGAVIRCCQDTGGAGSKALGVGNGLQGVIHCRERSPKRDQRGGVERSGVEMRVAAPFFTADKNICWDINLELWSSLLLLPHHPSSFRTNHHLSTPNPPPLSFTTHAHIHTLYPMFSLMATHTGTLTATLCNYRNIHAQTHNWMQCLSQTGRNKCDPYICGKKMQSRAETQNHVCLGLRGRGAERLPQRPISPSLLPLATVGETPPSGCPLIGTFACTPSLISQPSSITHRDQ